MRHKVEAKMSGLRLSIRLGVVLLMIALVGPAVTALPVAGAHPHAVDLLPDIQQAQERWASAGEAPTYTMTFRWSCPSSPGLPCLGVGPAPFNDLVTTEVVDGETVSGEVDLTVTELLDLLAIHHSELSSATFDPSFGYPTAFVFGPSICLGPPATPDDPGGCPGAPQQLSFEMTAFNWGQIVAAQIARFDSQLALWQANRPDSYAFTLRYSCFCPQVERRIVVTDGVGRVVPTSFDDDPNLEGETIDDLMARLSSNVRSFEIVSPVTYDSDLGFALTAFYRTAHPLIADGFGGFVITDFTDGDAFAAENAMAASRWAANQPPMHQFVYQQRCFGFCLPVGPVTVTVADGEIIDPVVEPIALRGRTIEQILDITTFSSSPPLTTELSLANADTMTYDPAWGFPSAISRPGPPDIFDHEFSSSVHSFVPLNGETSCGGMTPTRVGTDGDDVLMGTDGVDVIWGGAGDDQIYGLGGNDFLCGGDGDDLVSGGDGDDYVSGGVGGDELHGLAGNDIIEGGFGEDFMRGQAGDDRLVGGPDNDDLFGARGNDSVYGESGNDRVRGGTGDDIVDGGSGDDFVSGNGGEDMVSGGTGVDELLGGPRPDVLDGGDGNDLLRGLGGADELRGGAGDDELRGNQQNDRRVDGGLGTDTCNGGPGIEALSIVINCQTLVAIP